MSEVSAPMAKLLGSSMLLGIGPAKLPHIAALTHFVMQSIDLAVLLSAVSELLEVGSWDRAFELPEAQIKLAAKTGARILPPLDLDCPSLLSKTKGGPFPPFVKGHLAAHPEK